MSRQNTLTPDPRDMRPAGRPSDHYVALTAPPRAIQVTVDHYVALAAEVHTFMAAQAPVTAADFLPPGPDHADAEPVL